MELTRKYNLCNFSLTRCFDDTTWAFIGYNMTGYSIANMMSENLFNSLPHVIEELVLMQSGNFVSSSLMQDDVVVVADKNLVTAMDDNSLQLVLTTFVKKLG